MTPRGVSHTDAKACTHTAGAGRARGPGTSALLRGAEEARSPAAFRRRSRPCRSADDTLHLRALAWSRENLTHRFSQRGEPSRSSPKAAKGGAGSALASGLHSAIQLPALAPCAFRAARCRSRSGADPGPDSVPCCGRTDAAQTAPTPRPPPPLPHSPEGGASRVYLHRHPIGQQRTRADALTPPLCPTLPRDAAGPAPLPRRSRPFPRPLSQLARRWEPAKALPIGRRRVALVIGRSA